MLFDIFEKLLDMSTAAIVVIAVVLLARAILFKAPKKYAYVLWTVVALRLLCPVSVSSPMSIYNILDLESQSILQNVSEQKANNVVDHSSKPFYQSTNTVEKTKGKVTQNDKIVGDNVNVNKDSDQITVDNNVNDQDSKTSKNSVAVESIVKPTWVKIGTYIWFAGVLIITFLNIYLFTRIKKITKYGVKLRENIYECDGIRTPFVLGILPAKIFIPFRLKESEQEYIIRHEKYHIMRKDNLIQIVAFILCVIYWFNPLVWISYYLMIRDMEMSCDEYVLAQVNSDIRVEYSKSLLSFATNSRSFGVGMLAFGESSTKSRVKHVLEFRKAGKWISIIAIFLFMLVGVSCLTDAKKNEADTPEKSTERASKENDSSKDNISVKKATIDIMQSQGADGTRIYYASENRMIFGGNYGLFVYDLKHHQFEQSLDLVSIGYDYTQGENSSEYLVSKDGNTVYFHHIAGDKSDEMLIYDISNDKLTRENYSLNRDDLYYGEYLTDGQEPDEDYNYTYASFLTSDGKIASVVLKSTFSTIGELGYTIKTDCDLKDKYKNYLVYPLFPKDEYKDLDYMFSKDIKNLSKIEISCRGKHYECTDSDVLKKIEEAGKNSKKMDGFGACPFESVMYITTKDGKKGMVVPATDDCNTWIMGDGSFEVGKYFAFCSLIKAGCIKEKKNNNSENSTTWSFSENNCQTEYSFGNIRFYLPGNITEGQKENMKLWYSEDKLCDEYEYTEAYSGDNQLAYLRISSKKEFVLTGLEKIGESMDHVGYNEDGVMSAAEYQDESGKKYIGWLGKERGAWFLSLYPADSSLTDGMAITKLIMESVK